MSDYRRFVSYIYLYENNVKSMNAGFVKVESRNGQCRLSLSLKNVYSGTGQCHVYLFIRVGQELRGIYMGDIQIRNHGCDWNFRTETANIGGSGYSLEQMSGMIIQSEGGKYYGTRWDQGDLDVGRFVTEWMDEKTIDYSDKGIEERTIEPLIEEKLGQRESLGNEYEEVECTEKEIVQNQHMNMKYIETGFLEKKADKIVEEVPSSLTATDVRYQNFSKILEQCPGMYPFEDDVIEACVRLEPQDIGMMPLDCWSYGSNSFLLHGYYSYRHLILARMKSDKDQNSIYILGVPGTQHSREAFMAGMFGFREFKPIREGEENTSNFGYWYTVL